VQPDLVSSVVLMQQPAAWRDEVITSWSYHDLHERLKKDGFHNIIMVHDLVGHQLTQTVRKIKYLHNIMQSIIAAEMTAVLQLTDIRAAKMLKEFLYHSKLRMRQPLADKAASENIESRCKVGPYEMLWMLNDAIKRMDEKCEKKDWVISGAREVGWLAWRPSLSKQELVWVDEDDQQEWAKDHIMSSHRIHADWMAKRSDLQCDEQGVPLMPQWVKECEKKKHTTLPTEVQQDEEVTIVINAEEQEIFTEHEHLLQQHPRMKKKVFNECYQYLTSQKKGITDIMEDQQKCKKQVRFALKKLIKEWRMKVRKKMDEGVDVDALALQCIPHAQKSMAMKKKKKPSEIWKEKVKSLKKKEKVAKKAKEDKAAENEDGQLKDKRVRVISEHAGRAAFGQSGMCLSHKKGSVHLQTDDMTSFHIFDEYIMEDMDTKEKPITKKPLTKLSNNMKDDIIAAIGKDIGPITIQDAHLSMMWKWYEWQYELDHRVVFMSPTACRILFEVDEKDMGKDGLMHLQDQIIGAQMILCPKWAASEHLTLLAISIVEKEVRYYDSLQPASAMCKMNAMKIIHELKKMAAWDWIPHGLEITIRNAAYQSNSMTVEFTQPITWRRRSGIGGVRAWAMSGHKS